LRWKLQDACKRGRAGSELPPVATTLEIRLERDAGGTTVTIIHSSLPESEIAGHREGWLHFLPRLAVMRKGCLASCHRFLSVGCGSVIRLVGDGTTLRRA
jgi:hypothetical protein